jgi:hypothetical protein
MLIEASLLPSNLFNEGNHRYTILTVSVRTFVIPFYYGSGSGPLRQKVTVPTVPVPVAEHWEQDQSQELPVVKRN